MKLKNLSWCKTLPSLKTWSNAFFLPLPHQKKVFSKYSFTTLLLGHYHSGAPFRDVLSISVVLSLGVVLQLSNITPGGSEAMVVGRNTSRK